MKEGFDSRCARLSCDVNGMAMRSNALRELADGRIASGLTRSGGLNLPPHAVTSDVKITAESTLETVHSKDLFLRVVPRIVQCLVGALTAQ